MTGGGEGLSVVEVAIAFPARLLGATGELKNSNFQTKEEEERKRLTILKKFKEKWCLLFQPDQAFIG